MFTSASRTVFILMTIALCIFTATGQVDAKDFIMLVGMVFSYYFGKNNNLPPSQ